ncbi:hypothetical protein AQUCO_03700014v1 [Aquilegia coerulea]|uniref:Uncharacterized protein n=1 Tax=Aquilegia coerulea TaxID=218851 RepID=A0A2G5CT42_AQUCA|nr:hypothetical protein AQUCO_03700014v1 [Aquilegia coerulea]
MYTMISRRLLGSRRILHSSSSYDGPSEALKKEIARLEKKRKKMKFLKKYDLFVEVRESTAYLDTMKMPMVLTFVVVALFAKILMTVLSFP